jgi:cation diffusion facilitator CzcD-associated flavoprotein CzcO
VAIIGAGSPGLETAARLKEPGEDLFVVLENRTASAL